MNSYLISVGIGITLIIILQVIMLVMYEDERNSTRKIILPPRIYITLFILTAFPTFYINIIGCIIIMVLYLFDPNICEPGLNRHIKLKEKYKKKKSC